MKVKDLMTKQVTSCAPETNLAIATELMWNTDCGILPVVDHGALTGILTDRDICIALGTRNQLASNLTAKDVAATEVVTCSPDADVHSAMHAMRKEKIRRLPVTEDGELRGILTLNDLVDAVNSKHGDLSYDEVMNTMKAICEHRAHKMAAA